MGRAFRSTGGSAVAQSNYGNPQGVGQNALHASTARNNVPNPRAVSLPIGATAAVNQPATRRKWRNRPWSNERVVTREEGTGPAQEPPNPTNVGVGNGYGPSGAPDESTEPLTHLQGTGGPNQTGEQTPSASGGFDGLGRNPVDIQTMRGGINQTDPRRLRVTTGAPTAPFEPGRYATIDQYLVNAQVSAPGVPDQKPQVWFHIGRPAKKNMQFFLRPFDQTARYENRGRKLLISAPPTFGDIITTTGNRASFPIKTSVQEDTVGGAAYSGTKYGPVGMSNYSGPRKNTFRAAPQPWDTKIVDTGGGL